MSEAKAIITEDGLADYLRCPLRYAFVWHYGIDPDEKHTKFKALLRTALSMLYRCGFDGDLTLSAMKRSTAKLAAEHPQVWTNIWGILLKHSAYVKDAHVIAYSIPTKTKTESGIFTGMIDLATFEADKLVLSRLSSPDSTTASGSIITDCVRHGFASTVLYEAGQRNLTSVWQDMSLVRSTICFNIMRDAVDTRPFLAAVMRGIATQSFYPRVNPGVCLGCYFKQACSPKWCAVERLRTPLQTREEILSELTA